MKRIFKIKILKWNEYNSKHKSSYKKTQISNNFCTDAKIMAMPMNARWLFLGLLLMCGDYNKDTLEINERQLKGILNTSASCIKALRQLESFKLVTLEVFDLPLQKRKEVNRREEKRKEFPGGLKNPKVEPPKKLNGPANDPDANKVAWTAYHDAYVKRWKQEPIQDAKMNSAISSIVKRVGAKDAPEILQFYLHHTDGQYVRSTHSIGLALRDIESLRTQWLNGKAITANDVRKFEKQSSFQDTLRSIEKDGI